MMTAKSMIGRLQFGECFLGLFVDPFYLARRGLVGLIGKYGSYIGGITLDVGCGSKPYRHLFNVSSYIGLEVTQDKKGTDKPDCYYDGQNFPFGAGIFDSAVCSQVLEHVFTPEEFLREISRVLVDRGTVLITVPFVWAEHEQPYDCARYSSFGLAHLMRENGFEILAQDKSPGGIGVACQLANAYLHEVCSSAPLFFRLAVLALLMVPINILGALCELLLPASDSLYLDNIIVARKKGAASV
jgi:SAM-dependent methyltransferase